MATTTRYSFTASVIVGNTSMPTISDATCTLEPGRLVATDGSRVHQMAYSDIAGITTFRSLWARKIRLITLKNRRDAFHVKLVLKGSPEEREDVFEHVSRALLS